MKTYKNRSFVAAIAASLQLSPSAFAQTTATWSSAGNGNWSTVTLPPS